MDEETPQSVCIRVPWDHPDEEIRLIIAISFLLEHSKTSLMVNLEDDAILRAINYIYDRYNR